MTHLRELLCHILPLSIIIPFHLAFDSPLYNRREHTHRQVKDTFICIYFSYCTLQTLSRLNIRRTGILIQTFQRTGIEHNRNVALVIQLIHIFIFPHFYFPTKFVSLNLYGFFFPNQYAYVKSENWSGNLLLRIVNWYNIINTDFRIIWLNIDILFRFINIILNVLCIRLFQFLRFYI